MQLLGIRFDQNAYVVVPFNLKLHNHKQPRFINTQAECILCDIDSVVSAQVTLTYEHYMQLCIVNLNMKFCGLRAIY